MKYLYVDQHNGHFKTYHPFTSEVVLTQESVTSRLSKLPGAARMSTCLNQLLDILRQDGYQAEIWHCECCGSEVWEIENPTLKDWTVLEGISGNY